MTTARIKGRHNIDRRASRILTDVEGDADDLLTTGATAQWLGVSEQWLELGRTRKYGPKFKRIALLRSDCELLGRRPAFNVKEKSKDTRAPWFRKNYGQLCWELDAMDPNDLRDRVEAEIRKHIDIDAWDRCRTVDIAERESMAKFLSKWKK